MNVVELTHHDDTFSWVAKDERGRVIARGATDDYTSRADAMYDIRKFASDGYSVTESRKRTL